MTSVKDNSKNSDSVVNAGLTRRQFLAASATTAGLASVGLGAGWAANPRQVSIKTLATTTHECDVLVIGGGMAGLFAAVKAHDAGASVTMVAKGRLGSSGLTPFAKGFFVFEPENEDMTMDEYVATVGRSALGTNNPIYTRQTAELSRDRAAELTEWGFFENKLYNSTFMKPITERNIDLKERVVVTHLLKDGERIAGAAGFSVDDNELFSFRAKSVILCTGAGGFKPNGFPVCDLTHDGTVMAYNIGAKVTGKEWNDGHAGRSVNPAATYDGWGDMFERTPGTDGVGIRHDLGVGLNYAAYKTGNPLIGGMPGQFDQVEGGPHRPAEFDQNNEERRGAPPRPNSDGADTGGGPPPGDGKRPPHEEGEGPPGFGGSMVGGASAGMSIHKSEGLVPVNDQCESTIPGLYAAGDALGSHMCGAIYTQIGSSLAGSAVQGGVAGEAAARYAKQVDAPNISASYLSAIEEDMVAPLKREAGYGPAWVTQTLQGIMIPNFVLYIKKEPLLQAALAYVEELRDHHLPMLRASDLHELRLAHETANMIISAEMKLRASIMRKESRCSHYRLDYPEVDDENWRAWINLYKDENNNMQLEKQAFGSWPQ